MSPRPGVAVVPAPFVERPGELELTGRMIVRPFDVAEWVNTGLAPAVAKQTVRAAVALLGASVVQHIPATGEYLLTLPAGENEDSFARRLLASGRFHYAHPDWLCFPLDTPNDPFYGNQWHHPVIQSPQAWDLTHGGAEVICAFVDTGVDLDHPDLAAHLVPGYNSVDRVAQLDGGDVADINGHGTAVAGTACAIGDNGLGVAGVGWNQRIMMVRTSNLTNGNASMSNILDGARWAAENGARVVSASYSGVNEQSVNQTGRVIRDDFDALFCFAAGNSNDNLGSFDHRYVVVVGATTFADAKASFSSYGRAVDVFAPGVSVWSTRNGGSYGGVSGTSFSTPMTNGVLSMVWSVGPSLSADQVELIVFETCDDLGDPGDDDVFGHGRVNVFRAVQAGAATEAGNVAPVARPDAVVAYTLETIAIDATRNDYDFNLDALSITGFDAVSAQGGVLGLSAGTGPQGRDELMYTPPPGYLGGDSLSYTISDGLLTDSATIDIEVLDGSGFRIPENPEFVELNLASAYYALSAPQQLPDFDPLTPYATGLAPDINFGWSSGSFGDSGRADEVGAVFHGFVEIPTTDVYTFYLISDAGSRLWIGDDLVVDHDGLHGFSEASGPASLRPGLHALRIEYFEATGYAGLIAKIESAAIPKKVIPASMLYHESCAPDLDGDGQVTLTDLSLLLSNFGASGAAPEDGDLNGDETVDLVDLSLLLAAFGAPCASGLRRLAAN